MQTTFIRFIQVMLKLYDSCECYSFLFMQPPAETVCASGTLFLTLLICYFFSGQLVLILIMSFDNNWTKGLGSVKVFRKKKED